MLEKLIERANLICDDCYPSAFTEPVIADMHERCYNAFVAVMLLKLDLMARYDRLTEWENE